MLRAVGKHVGRSAADVNPVCAALAAWLPAGVVRDENCVPPGVDAFDVAGVRAQGSALTRTARLHVSVHVFMHALRLTRKPATHAAFILAVGGLLGFHISLIARGLTTYESIESFGSTFSEGCCRNCRAVWCTRLPPPYVDFTAPLRTAYARQPPAVIRMVNPHLSRECGTPVGSSSHRSSRTPRREPREMRELGGRAGGHRVGERVNGGGFGRSPRRLEGTWVEYAPRAERQPGGLRWEKPSPRGNGHIRLGDDAV